MPLASCSSMRESLKTSPSATYLCSRGMRSGATWPTYADREFHVSSPWMVSESKSSLKMSRMTRIAMSGSPRSSLGALPFLTSSSMVCHWRLRRSTSARSSSSEAPSAAVRTMTPASAGMTSRSSFLRRARSVSGSLREIPVTPPAGTYTRKRPASEICDVTRAPLWPMGSLVTCTITVSPGLSASSMRRGLPSSPAASQLTSPA